MVQQTQSSPAPAPTPPLKRTPLHDVHGSLGAKMVPFGGYLMPVSYPGGIAAEHRAVREAVGIFDVSHMGEFEITGPDRNAFVQRVTCNDVGALEPGGAQYSALLTGQGTFADDCVVYRFDDRLMLVVNASHIAKGTVAGAQCFVSRTGYTGEDGFEVYCRAVDLERLWHALAGAGRAEPCGLGARDTLRLEAGYPLYGNDIDDTVTPLEAGLGWIVKLDKGADFTGLAALKRQKLEGVKRRLVGFKVLEPRVVARPGHAVYLDGRRLHHVPARGRGAAGDAPGDRRAWQAGARGGGQDAVCAEENQDGRGR